MKSVPIQVLGDPSQRTVRVILVVCFLALLGGLGVVQAAGSSRDLRYFFYAYTGPFGLTPLLPNGPPNQLDGAVSINTPIRLRNPDTGALIDPSNSQGIRELIATSSPGSRVLVRMLPLGPTGPIDLKLRSGAKASLTVDQITDQYSLGAVVRRAALDGSEYEAVPVTIERNGRLLHRQYLGYRLGSVAASSEGATERMFVAERYELVSLPAPVAEGTVTEYVYGPSLPASPWGHFFYAASEAERTLLDESPDWMRSGREFKSGGYLPVCRFFYRPTNGTPATHFYTAKADECERFKTTPGFTYEGTPFRASLPRPQVTGQGADDTARCPEKTVPLWRYFNQPGSPVVAPNHRYLLTKSIGDWMRELGTAPSWVPEGISLCVPE
jgi:hypothetical protein